MFNFAQIESDMIQRAIIRIEIKQKIKSGLLKKPARFGQTLYWRKFRRVKKKDYTRNEPPILKQSNPFKGESAEYPQNFVKKGFKRPTIRGLL